MKLLDKLAANRIERKLSIDDYIFYIFLYLSTIISFISIIGNIITNYPMEANIKWVLSIFLCAVGLILISKRLWVENYKTLIFIIIIGALIFPSWFYGGGDNTFTLMYLLVIASQALMMFRSNLRRIFFVAVCITMGISLVIIEYNFPQFITPTNDQNVFLDSLIQIIIVFSISAASLGIYTQSYRNQHLKLEKIAYVDTLSGVYNRRKIIEVLEQSLAGAIHPYTYLLMLDIDYFKGINDKNGHLVGDHIITNLGAHITNTLGSLGCGGRYGGDEFLLLLKCEQATLYAIVETLQTDLESDGIAYSISGGITKIQANSSPDALISTADKMLYKAKERGRNRIYLWNDYEILGGKKSNPNRH